MESVSASTNWHGFIALLYSDCVVFCEFLVFFRSMSRLARRPSQLFFPLHFLRFMSLPSIFTELKDLSFYSFFPQVVGRAIVSLGANLSLFFSRVFFLSYLESYYSTRDYLHLGRHH